MKVPELFVNSRETVRPAARKLARAIFKSGDWEGCLRELPHADTEVMGIGFELWPGMGDAYGPRETCKLYLFQDAWQKLIMEKLDVMKEPDRTTWYLRRRDGLLEGTRFAWYCAMALEYSAGFLPTHRLSTIEEKAVCFRVGRQVLALWDELFAARPHRYSGELYNILRKLGCAQDDVMRFGDSDKSMARKILEVTVHRAAEMPECHLVLEGAGWPPR